MNTMCNRQIGALIKNTLMIPYFRIMHFYAIMESTILNLSEQQMHHHFGWRCINFLHSCRIYVGKSRTEIMSNSPLFCSPFCGEGKIFW